MCKLFGYYFITNTTRIRNFWDIWFFQARQASIVIYILHIIYIIIYIICKYVNRLYHVPKISNSCRISRVIFVTLQCLKTHIIHEPKHNTNTALL